MERENIFRGKCVDEEMWVEGPGINTQYDIRGEKHIYIGVPALSENYPKMQTITWFEVIPETVGQYTGIADKKGDKIFELHIVAGALSWQERKKNGVVAFRDGSFGLIWYRGEIEHFNPFTSMCNVEYEVIGNAYDHPELIKGGTE